MKQTKIEWARISDLIPHEINPRGITESRMEQLKESITNFPKMLEYRPIIADKKTGRIIAGNQRHEACKQLGWESVPVIYVEGLDERKMRELMLKDNLQFGEWDFSKLKEGYTQTQLLEWGLEDAKYVSFFDQDDQGAYDQEKERKEPESKEPEYDNNSIKKIIFNLSSEEYDSTVEALAKFNERFGLEDNSQALQLLLQLHENEAGI